MRHIETLSRFNLFNIFFLLDELLLVSINNLAQSPPGCG